MEKDGVITITSLMSENESFILYSLGQYIRKKMDVPVQIVGQIPLEERQHLLDAGQIEIAWICGLPYVLRADLPDPEIELLAAPVMSGERYQNQPVYFSDVVVRRDSRFRIFADLRGRSWAYNEPLSHSGYNVVRYYLAVRGETSKYFGEAIESGSHLASLDLILKGEIDASAIDSIVLEIELQRRPYIRQELRIIETLGPSPVPPLVISRRLPQETRETLKRLLTEMANDQSGKNSLEQARLERLSPVTDSDYDPIRDMYLKGKDIVL